MSRYTISCLAFSSTERGSVTEVPYANMFVVYWTTCYAKYVSKWWLMQTILYFKIEISVAKRRFDVKSLHTRKQNNVRRVRKYINFVLLYWHASTNDFSRDVSNRLCCRRWIILRPQKMSISVMFYRKLSNIQVKLLTIEANEYWLLNLPMWNSILVDTFVW